MCKRQSEAWSESISHAINEIKWHFVVCDIAAASNFFCFPPFVGTEQKELCKAEKSLLRFSELRIITSIEIQCWIEPMPDDYVDLLVLIRSMFTFYNFPFYFVEKTENRSTNEFSEKTWVICVDGLKAKIVSLNSIHSVNSLERKHELDSLETAF